MQVTYTYNQPVNTQAWNYIYMTSKGGSNVCDVNISNNAQIDAPVYVEGNLCFDNNTNIRQDLTPTIPISVIVKGKVQWANNDSSIGISTTNYIDSAYIAGGCGSSLAQRPHLQGLPDLRVGYDPIFVRCTACFSTTPALGDRARRQLDDRRLLRELEPRPHASLYDELGHGAAVREHDRRREQHAPEHHCAELQRQHPDQSETSRLPPSYTCKTNHRPSSPGMPRRR